jgi:hypothetical protein
MSELLTPTGSTEPEAKTPQAISREAIIAEAQRLGLPVNADLFNELCERYDRLEAEKSAMSSNSDQAAVSKSVTDSNLINSAKEVARIFEIDGKPDYALAVQDVIKEFSELIA